MPAPNSLLPCLQAERTHRGEMDTLLDQTREQLDASRRECGGLHGEVAQRLKEIQALQGELRVTKRELGDRLHELALLQGREHEYVQQVATMEVGGGSLVTAGVTGVHALPFCSKGLTTQAGVLPCGGSMCTCKPGSQDWLGRARANTPIPGCKAEHTAEAATQAAGQHAQCLQAFSSQLKLVTCPLSRQKTTSCNTA